MNAGVAAGRLAWILDLLALLSLAGTGEIRGEIFVIVAVAFVVSRLSLVRMSQRVQFFLFLSVLVGALSACWHFRFHPIVSAAYAAPLVHALSWFVESGRRNRSWRMGMGVVELILAAALTTEVYLFLTLFVYVIIGSVVASCNYLEAQLERRAPTAVDEALPVGFLKRSLGLALVIFLSSAVVFPILPRLNLEDGGGFGSGFTQVGYTESVSLNENFKIDARGGNGRPVLWLYPHQKQDLSLALHGGLLRGRPMDFFDGAQWLVIPRRLQQVLVRPDPVKMAKAIYVDAVRAPLATSVLPTPYGTMEVFSGTRENPAPFPRMGGGEWLDLNSLRERTRFTFAFLPYWEFKEDRRLEDSPLGANLGVPEGLNTDRMRRLTSRIFGNANLESEKVERLRTYFANDGFRPSLDGSAMAALRDTPGESKMHALEKFIFISKQGNCEWFATSSAVLLRMGGVPTRLVAGFRITHAPVGGVLTVNSEDAHAWVEFWQNNRGWVPLDVTPRIQRVPAVMDFFRNGYDLASGYWYRYILSYRDGRVERSTQDQPGRFASSHSAVSSSLKFFERNFRSNLGEDWLWTFGGFLFFFSLVGVSLYIIQRRIPWLFLFKSKSRSRSGQLQRERIYMERLLAAHFSKTDFRNQKGVCLDEASQERFWQDRPLSAQKAFQLWFNHYSFLRFGPKSPVECVESVMELKRQYGEFRRLLELSESKK